MKVVLVAYTANGLMQENTEPKKQENPDSFDKEESIPDEEESTPPESTDSTESDSGFEDQEGELLPPDGKKKSGAGKVFLLLILVLAGSGGYLYFNNLIPAEILNLVFPKPAPSKPPALVTQTPLSSIEEAPAIAETQEPVEVTEAIIAEPATVPPVPSAIEETHISGDITEPSTASVSGNKFDQPVTEEELQETASLEEPNPVAVEQEIVEEQEFSEEPATETIPVPEPVEDPAAETTMAQEPASPEPNEPMRSKAAQAYLDFIESSVQKLGELIKEGFNLAWNFITGNS